MKYTIQQGYWSLLLLFVLTLINQPIITAQQGVGGSSSSSLIYVLSPRDGIIQTRWLTGNSYSITWKSKNIPNIRIELFRGTTLVETIVASTVNVRSYTYQVNPALPTASNYRVKVMDAANPQVFGWSDYVEIIQNLGSITVLAPIAGNQWEKEKVHTIRWTDDLTVPAQNMVIELFRGGTFVETISTYTANDGYYSYYATSTLQVANDYRIKISNVDNSTVFAWSDFFSIIDPPLGVISALLPNGDTWEKGKVYPITWTDNIPDLVRLELHHNGSLVQIINQGTESDGHYNYRVPLGLATSNQYSIKIIDVTDATVFDESNLFTITDPPTNNAYIDIEFPTGNTIWNKGLNYNIRWDNNIQSHLFRIELYKGSQLKKVIVDSTSNDASYAYNVPTDLPVDDDYYVKVSSVSDPSIYDISEDFWVHTTSPASDAFIEVSRPDSGEVFYRGQMHLITWGDNLVEEVRIIIEQGGITRYVINNVKSDGAYLWTIPADAGVFGVYKVKIESTIHPIIWGESEVFVIREPSTAPAKSATSNPPLVLPPTLSLVPNPQSKGQASRLLVNSPTTEKATLRVVDITGKVVIEQQLALFQGDNTLLLEALPHAGWYVVSIQTSSSLESKALLVQD